ncbi:hypothetical protein D3C81_1827360 [compost metagenome]
MTVVEYNPKSNAKRGTDQNQRQNPHYRVIRAVRCSITAFGQQCTVTQPVINLLEHIAQPIRICNIVILPACNGGNILQQAGTGLVIQRKTDGIHFNPAAHIFIQLSGRIKLAEAVG